MGMAAAGYNLLVAGVYLGGGWIADVTSPAAAVAGAGLVGLALTGIAAAWWPTDALWRRVGEVYEPAESVPAVPAVPAD